MTDDAWNIAISNFNAYQCDLTPMEVRMAAQCDLTPMKVRMAASVIRRQLGDK